MEVVTDEEPLEPVILQGEERQALALNIWILFHKFLRRKEVTKAIVTTLAEVGQQKTTVWASFNAFL